MADKAKHCSPVQGSVYLDNKPLHLLWKVLGSKRFMPGRHYPDVENKPPNKVIERVLKISQTGIVAFAAKGPAKDPTSSRAFAALLLFHNRSFPFITD